MRKYGISGFLAVIMAGLLLFNCEPSNDIITVRDLHISQFRAETNTDSGLEFSDSSEPITIFVGERVTFSNNSETFVEDVDFNGRPVVRDTPPVPYSGGQNWTFDGGTPATSQDELVTVTYNTPGTYKVALNLTASNSRPLEVEDYVTVLEQEAEETEAFFYLEREENDDGRSTEFVYETDNVTVVLKEALKFLNEELQERSTYSYNENGSFARESFSTPDGSDLGTRSATYDGENRISSELIETSDGTLVQRVDFEYGSLSDLIPIGGNVTQPDGAGGTVITSFEYTKNTEGTHVERVDFTRLEVPIGYTLIEYDNSPKVFTNLRFLNSYPDYFSDNNIISQKSYDINEELLQEVQSTFQYGSEEESGGAPLTANIITRSGMDESTSTRDFFYLRSER